CLVVDAWAWKRSGASIWSRSRGSFAVLFLMSAPMWWLFELINWRTRNWEYLGREAFTDLEYFVLASVSFSTVLPAVFGTARLMSTFAWVQRLQGMGGFTLSAARC